MTYFILSLCRSRNGKRIIGLRRASRREGSHYVKAIQEISLKMPTLEEDQLITAAEESDPEALPLTDEQMTAMVPMRVLRSRPKLANNQQLVSIRYSPEVIGSSGPQLLVGKHVWMPCARNMSKLTQLAMLRGPNIKMQKTGARVVFYTEGSARF